MPVLVEQTILARAFRTLGYSRRGEASVKDRYQHRISESARHMQIYQASIYGDFDGIEWKDQQAEPITSSPCPLLPLAQAKSSLTELHQKSLCEIAILTTSTSHRPNIPRMQLPKLQVILKGKGCFQSGDPLCIQLHTPAGRAPQLSQMRSFPKITLTGVPNLGHNCRFAEGMNSPDDSLQDHRAFFF
ncbi:hypothetical protein BDD12DRAFT_874903 [Trichophaea hybrida]|nr:hypothetical protein BDD12DRAFT_874903 [Trichophaea hybrida]